MWQDYILSAGEVIFCVTLIPMLLAKEKPPLSSSILTGSVLIVCGVVFGTLHLWLAFVSQIIVGLQWFWLAVQKIKQRDSSLPH